MGQGALTYALLGATIILTLTLTLEKNRSESGEDSAREVHRMLAREAANTGLNLTLRRLVANPDAWESNPAQFGFTNQPYRNTTFTATVSPTEPLVVSVTVLGKSSAEEFDITARYTLDTLRYATNVNPVGEKKTLLCHIPPGNPANAHTLSVGNASAPAHLAHGDFLGSCSAGPPLPAIYGMNLLNYTEW